MLRFASATFLDAAVGRRGAKPGVIPPLLIISKTFARFPAVVAPESPKEPYAGIQGRRGPESGGDASVPPAPTLPGTAD